MPGGHANKDKYNLEVKTWRRLRMSGGPRTRYSPPPTKTMKDKEDRRFKPNYYQY